MVRLPVLQVHSTADQIVPIEHGRALSDAWQHVRYVEVHDLSHNASPLLSDPTAHAAWTQFLIKPMLDETEHTLEP
jgi:dipeptidyl aminopeptidase/acylaminoacyl peptidase